MNFYNTKVRGLFASLVLGLLMISLHSNGLCQKVDTSGRSSSTVPSDFVTAENRPIVKVDTNFFADYVRVMSLPLNERPKAYSRLSNEQKAIVTRLKLMFQLIDLGELNDEQRKLITRMISSITPEIYDRSNIDETRKNDLIAEEFEAMTFALFPDRTARAILMAQNAEKENEMRRIKRFQVLAETVDGEARKALAQLSNEERAAMWKIKLGYHLVATQLTSQQVEFIARFIGELDSVFRSVSTMSPAEREVAGQTMENKIATIFSPKDAVGIFNRFGKIETNSNDDPEIEEGAWSCTCRWACDGDGQVCRQGGCTDSNYCGPTGTWACTGRCIRP